MKILSRTYNFPNRDLRQGILTFDNDEYAVETKGTYGLANDKSLSWKLHYYFDTKVHVEFAKIQDQEDWDEVDNIVYSSIQNMFIDVWEDAIDKISSNPDLDDNSNVRMVQVLIDVYGFGNRYCPVKFGIYPVTVDTGWGTGNPASFRWDIDEIENSLKRKPRVVWVGDKYFRLKYHQLYPDNYTLKRKVVPAIVNYVVGND